MLVFRRYLDVSLATVNIAVHIAVYLSVLTTDSYVYRTCSTNSLQSHIYCKLIVCTISHVYTDADVTISTWVMDVLHYISSLSVSQHLTLLSLTKSFCSISVTYTSFIYEKFRCSWKEFKVYNIEVGRLVTSKFFRNNQDHILCKVIGHVSVHLRKHTSQ